MRAGRRTEYESRQQNRKTPRDGDLHAPAAFHSGLLQKDVGNDAVAEKYEHCGADKLSHETGYSIHNAHHYTIPQFVK